ncbi:ATP-binding protein [Pseudonocardia sp. HH130630-07]|uniref:ATP-binding protein n=1 Tax=Pseudonocardia sp. HH130630-07 TaxID=1690815 RepID=UPI00081509DA|nr:ATP-binding protein [Pseudonocardia sp. HH130630-07]ANY07178.1 hypothetical protein AFB00_13800 [Pseudonocardia sp. HH130630-07]
MPTLIQLNGLPGTGKSTLAEHHVQRFPPAVNLDPDVLRGLVGGWYDAPQRAGLLTRRMVLAAARVALTDGVDVVVPQFLARAEFLDSLAGLAGDCGARFVPVVLHEPLGTTVARLRARAAGPMTPAQRDAHRTLDPAVLPEWHRRLRELVDARPGTAVVTPVVGDVAATHQALLAVAA